MVLYYSDIVLEQVLFFYFTL